MTQYFYFDYAGLNSSRAANRPLLAPATIQFQASNYTVSEDGGTVYVTITRTGGGVDDIGGSVDYTTFDNDAVAGLDYTQTSGTVFLGQFEQVQTIAIPILADNIAENDETFFVQLSNVQSGFQDTVLGSPSTAMVRITPPPPKISINDIQVTEGNSGITNATFTVSLSAASNTTTTVNFATANNSAAAGSDFNGAAGTLTFNPGVTTQTVTVQVIGDTAIEANETFLVNLSNPVNGTFLDSQGICTINNDDQRAVSINDVAVTEGNSGTTNAVFTVTLSQAHTQAVSVTYETANGTAQANGDFLGNVGTLTIPAGSTAQTITVLVNGDFLIEPTETFSLYLTSATNATLADNHGLGTINNDDANGQLKFSTSAYSIDENAASGLATITVTRSGGLTGAVSVNYATSNGTAKSPSDYGAANGTITFAQGDATPKTFTIPIADDAFNEGNETVALTLSSPTGGATLGSPSTASLTIVDNDPLPTFSITDVSIAEGNSGSLNAVFTVSLNGLTGRTVKVNVATADGTAMASTNDYLAINGTLTFTEGNTSQTVIVPVNGDTILEANETFTVNLSAPVAAAIADGQGLGTITNDDAGFPGMTINDIVVTEGNSGTVSATFTLSLSVAVPNSVSVNFTTANNTAVAGSDFVAASGTLTFPANTATRTLTVTVNSDLQNELTESFFLNLSSPVNAVLLDDRGVATINNDDAVPSLSINNVSVSEGNGGQTNCTFTVSLSTASGQDVTVNFATANGTATTENNDYAVATGTLTIPAGAPNQKLTVIVNGDTNIEQNETFTVSLSSPVNATIGNGQGTATILNDEALPAITIKDVSANEGQTISDGEFGQIVYSDVPFILTLSDPSPVDISLDVTVDGVTATPSLDFDATVPNTTRITIPAGKTQHVYIVRVASDNTQEANETFTVTLSNAVNATIADNQAVCTISDDDSSFPIFNFKVTELAVDELDNAIVTVRVVRSKTIGFASINYQISGGTAINDLDYTAANSGTLTFEHGISEASFTVTIIGDAISEANETIVFTLGDSGVNLNTATINIGDNDPRPRLVVNDLSVLETDSGTANAAIVLQLIDAAGFPLLTGQPVTVNYATANNTAVSGEDYQAVSGTATIQPGTSSLTINVPIIGDTNFEPDETFFFNLSSVSKAVLADGQAICTILTNEVPGQIVLQSPGSLGEGVGAINVVVKRINGNQGAISAQVVVTGGTAIQGTDYSFNATTVSFANGDTADKVVSIPIINDSFDEEMESINLGLSNPTGGATVGGGVSVFILDDDASPGLSVSSAEIVEGNSGTSIMTFTVTLSSPTQNTVLVRYETVDGSALATDNDYGPTTNLLSFEPGATTRTFPVNIKGDTKSEQDESFQVRLFAAENAVIATETGIGTIRDDDASSLQFSLSQYNVDENTPTGMVTITVTRTGSTAGTASVMYATSDGTATAGSDYTSTSGTLNFAANEPSKTFTIPITDDTTVEPNETVTLTLSNAMGAMLGTPATATLTIRDNDQNATLQFNPATYTVNENAGSVTLTVTRTGNTTGTVTVNYSTGGGTATAGSDYTSTSNTLTFNNGEAAKTFTVPILDDMIAEGGETFNVTLSAPSANAQLGSATSATVTINDNESNTEVKFELTSYTVSEGTATLTIKVKRTGSLTGTSSVAYVISNSGVTNPATAGADYTAAASGTLNFAANDDEEVITITIVNDALVECNEMFKITLENAVNATIAGTNPVMVTIMEDDVMQE